MGQFLSVDHETYHMFTAGETFSQEDMANESFMIRLVVWLHAEIFHEFQHCCQIILIFFTSEQAIQIRHWDQGMCPSRKESGSRLPVFSAADRILRLITVSPRIFHSDDRLHDDRARHSCCLLRFLWQEQIFHAPDAFQMVVYLLFFKL